MAQETKVEEARCSLQTFERNRYFYGKPMTVSDFEAEQRYLIGKQRYVNRLVHGAGVLCGLEVTLPESFSAERPRVELAEGAALDCCGNLIVVSRGVTADVKGDFDPEGLNYLYLKYAECSKQPVMLAANGSSCEEVCCYNRIQETFEVVASRTAPVGGEAAPTAKVPATKAAATGNPTNTAEEVCRALTEQYYQENLKTCPGCDDPLVFLAVLDAEQGEVNAPETARYRTVVYNNSMLHELLCKHVGDYDNPHHTTAEQVRALQSVNGVGNNSTRSFVANIDLKSKDNTVAIAPDKNASKIDLILAANAVKPSHLNEDLIKNLLVSSKTVTVEPNVAAKTISLRTTPAASVTSVGAARVVGTSSRFAPEDHAHDLAEGVVERKHFGKDVYENLLQGVGIVKVEADAADGVIKLSAEVAPGDDLKLVSSVAGTKRLGKSERYAREDHAHDLRLNGHPPDEKGQFLLTPGANISIEKGAADNELVINAEGGGAVVTTGTFVFEDVLPQEIRTSTLIAHRQDTGTVAVIVAQEEQEGLESAGGVRLNALDARARFGDVAAFVADAPFLLAEVDYGQKTIQLRLRDRRPSSRLDPSIKLADESDFKFAPTETAPPSGSNTTTGALPPPGTDGIVGDPDARTYRVRWWAIPA